MYIEMIELSSSTVDFELKESLYLTLQNMHVVPYAVLWTSIVLICSIFCDKKSIVDKEPSKKK